MALEDYVALHKVEIDALLAEAGPTLLRMAVEHLARQRQESFLMSLNMQGGASWLTREMAQDLEQNYRRGYHQGYSTAISHFSGTSDRAQWNRLGDYCDGPLLQWRNLGGRNAGMEAPPEPPTR